jgi:hypothetical protein
VLACGHWTWGALTLGVKVRKKESRTAPDPRGAHLVYIALAILPCRLSEPGPCRPCPSFCRAQAFCWCVAGTGTPSVCRRPTGVSALVMSLCRDGAGVGSRESREGCAVKAGDGGSDYCGVVGSWDVVI